MAEPLEDATVGTRSRHAAPLTDAQIDRLQKDAFDYFTELVNRENGLLPDTQRQGSPCSIAVVGFALSCWPIGVERGWIGRDEAADLTLKALRFFAASPQSDQPDATGHQGLYYHFLDMDSGRRVWDCELSLIDSGMLLAGILMAAEYFDGDPDDEQEIRTLARSLYGRVDWHWALDRQATIRQGWTPETGFFHYNWEGYSEGIILYVLAMASPGHALPNGSFQAWSETYQWEKIYGIDCLYAGPLFVHQFSHAWIDFRDIQDDACRAHDTDYFQNTCNAISIQRDYARLNPYNHEGYADTMWGFSACDGPSGEQTTRNGVKRVFNGYSERGVPYGLDDGTLAPACSLASLPFKADLTRDCIGALLARYPQVLDAGRIRGSFNPSLPDEDASDGSSCWVSENVYGLDQGLIVMMIENYRTGLPWRLMRSSQIMRRGLQRCGFTGGWLS